MSNKYGIRRGDFVIIGVVVLAALAIFLPFALAPARALVCEITQDGALVRQIRLGAGYEETVTITGSRVTNVIAVEGSTVRFASSDCPDQVCVRTGTLTRAGQVAVCLPNRVVVRLTGAGGQVDAVAA